LPRWFNPTVLPQYNGESNLREFLLKYEAAIEATGGGSACKAKALILALKGLAQQWYTNLPNGYIYSWEQLRLELATGFRAVKPDKVTSCNFHDLNQGSSTLQDYMLPIIKLRAKATHVAKPSIIDMALRGLNLGPCVEYLRGTS